MELKLNLGFEQIFSLANQLPTAEKEKLISALLKSKKRSESRNKERQLGKYEGQIWMSEDFNKTPDDFKEYM